MSRCLFIRFWCKDSLVVGIWADGELKHSVLIGYN